MVVAHKVLPLIAARLALIVVLATLIAGRLDREQWHIMTAIGPSLTAVMRPWFRIAKASRDTDATIGRVVRVAAAKVAPTTIDHTARAANRPAQVTDIVRSRSRPARGKSGGNLWKL